MNKVRILVTLSLVTTALVLGGGVASANPPGLDPYAGIPEPLLPIAHAVLPPIAGFFQFTWNTMVAVINTFSAT